MSTLFDTIQSLDDIHGLIADHTRESEVLEFKIATSPFTDREKQEIAKDISAMANSLGGLIVYGVSTDPVDKTLPLGVVPIDSKNIETLDRVINAQIRPPVNGVRRKLLPPDDPQVLLLDVPPSEDPPHQNLYDKKYYRRSGAECLPMEHDLVALKFGRKLAPILDLSFVSLSPPTAFSGEPPWSGQAGLRVYLRNSGRRVGRELLLLMRFPSSDLVRIIEPRHPLQNIDRLHQGQQARQFSGRGNVYHPGSTTSIVEIGLSFSPAFAARDPDEPLIEWTMFADEMPPRQGVVTVRDLGWILPANAG